MSVIEANINITIPDGVDPSQVIESIQKMITDMTDKDTHVNIVKVDDPMSLSPTRNRHTGIGSR